LTQPYIAGELSVLLAGLQPATDDLRVAVGNFRHEVEFSPLDGLPELAQDALDLTDLLCRAALEQGDADGFCRYAATATALRDFAVDAGLVP
jgi:hypothetical protein